MHASRLLFEEIRRIKGVNFEDPVEMFQAAAKLTTAQAKLSQYRTQAVKALDRAKAQIREELQKAIRHDPDLLERLCKIVDNVKVA